MLVDDLTKYKAGWFLGNFEPSLVKTKDFEIAVKHYKKGEKDPRHMHKVATELTYIAKGKCLFNDKLVEQGSIVQIAPGEFNSFVALTDVELFVIKFPSVPNDKYLD